MKHYNYIVSGAGCAGLSFLTRLLQTGQFNDKKILLIDRAPKTTNDRTWCFWEKDPGYFEPIVYHSWDQLWFHASDHSALHDIKPYRYKMIRGEDFYKHCFSIILQYPNVTIQYSTVNDIRNAEQGALLQTGDEFPYGQKAASEAGPCWSKAVEQYDLEIIQKEVNDFNAANEFF